MRVIESHLDLDNAIETYKSLSHDFPERTYTMEFQVDVGGHWRIVRPYEAEDYDVL